jgi:hypothetical protein
MEKLSMLICVLLISVSYAFSQHDSTCKVLLSAISGEYQGACRNGLAHGKGTARGEDTYTGRFSDGLPDGKGKYVYRNGNSFTGYWIKGIKHGSGKFQYVNEGKVFVLKGYWQNGEFAGKTDPEEFYRVTGKTGIENYTFVKKEGNENQVKISFESLMMKNIPKDLKINISSGRQLQMNKDFIIDQYRCPVNCTIHFVVQTAGGFRQCELMFEILQQGNYEVLITNM